ncbi:MAG: metal-dependent hydrolase [Candidatus Doudnabacteria bacterium]|nr:metal-dependent hydrolase [Candidatus Doudnabacteria bacterium]
MLPPGHIAGGFIASKVAANFVTPLDRPEFFILTSFFSFFPDLDSFISFAKIGKMISREDIDHRTYPTHAPLLYLLVFAIFYFLFPSYHYVSWAFLIGTWSHFLIDTFSAEGILWLWPFSKKFYNKQMDPRITITEQGFFKHWTEFLKKYFKVFSFKVEILLIAIALVLLFTNS